MKNKIRFMRNSKNISQYELAKQTGLTQSQISKIENGKRSLKNDEVILISRALGEDVKELFFEE